MTTKFHTAADGDARQAPGVLDDTLRQFSNVNPYLVLIPGTPTGDCWHRWDSLRDRDTLVSWRQLIMNNYGDSRVASSFLAVYLLGPLVDTWVTPFLAFNRMPLAEPGDMALRRTRDGWVDAVAIGHPGVAVLADDPAAGWQGAAISDSRLSMLDLVADRLLAAGTIIDALAGACNCSPSWLWGILADAVGGRAAWLAQQKRRVPVAASGQDASPLTILWKDVEAILDRLALRQPQLRTRPRLRSATKGAGPSVQRGICCLHYRVSSVASDPSQRNYCASCPIGNRS